MWFMEEEMQVFQKIWRALLTCRHRFEIRPFSFLMTTPKMAFNSFMSSLGAFCQTFLPHFYFLKLKIDSHFQYLQIKRRKAVLPL